MMHLQLYALLNSPPPTCPHHPPLPPPLSSFCTTGSSRNVPHSLYGFALGDRGRRVDSDLCLGRRIETATEEHWSVMDKECSRTTEADAAHRQGKSLTVERRQKGECGVRGEEHEQTLQASPSRTCGASDQLFKFGCQQDPLFRMRYPEQGVKDICGRCASMRDGTAHGVYFKYAALDIDFDALLKFRLALKRHGLFAFYRDERNKLNLLHVEG
ncbi:conserved hypothetical protein [Neospora caninum Liverpool]|uniref:Uncharacterized protein n=1 Tax=Neospora caninum (strain Liverpool) TaxID=572307 RepID=F0V9G5_NEOCL|nr:conserved hypothetical protein [Neospora caninum Liverpool]CBZ50390.1 conserved hypothetical protein [Neospora caninum Liverpool]CEL64998.1 TPA: hypothetical protein BN1204_008590 [Neospora caninum Liverpool]|eukprot:XP_003880424.1 conserved hypothetical protein [Neospora caninum Liverpool]